MWLEISRQKAQEMLAEILQVTLANLFIDLEIQDQLSFLKIGVQRKS